MKRWIAAIVSGFVLVWVFAVPEGAVAQETLTPEEVETKKRAQTGMKFLQISGDPRAVAMGNAVTASDVGTSRSLFYNPATMARSDYTFDVSFATMEYIADINYDFGSVMYQPGNGQYGVVGASIQSVDYGEVLRTIRADNEQGFQDVGTYSPTALAIGVGYARTITTRFTVGGQVKYVQQDMGAQVTDLSATVPEGGGSPDVNVGLGEFSESVIGYDFGVIYDTGFRSLRFAMSTRNFAPEFTYVEQNVEIPLTFRVGVQMDVMDLVPAAGEMHRLLVSAEGRRPRDFSEQVRFGGEYTFMNLISFRGGYAYPSEDHVRGVSLGGGLNYEISDVQFRADYAHTDMDVFDGVHRFGITLGF